MDKEVLHYLIERFEIHTTMSEFINWIKKVDKTGTVDEKRFLTCIAIDLNHKLIDINSFLSIISNVSFENSEHDPILTQFDKLILNNPEDFLVHSVCSSHSVTDSKKITYASVLRWSKLFRSINNYLRGTNKAAPAGIDESDFYYSCIFEQNSLNLDGILEWSGYKGLTWLVPLSELEEILESNGEYHDKVSIVRLLDKLGLDPPDRVEPSGNLDKYVYIVFPEDFNECCYQPTTLCGNWLLEEGLYLSYIWGNSFGRTYPATGKSPEINFTRERVISSKKYGNKNFIPKELGIPTRYIKDLSGILEEANKRFKHEG